MYSPVPAIYGAYYWLYNLVFFQIVVSSPKMPRITKNSAKPLINHCPITGAGDKFVFLPAVSPRSPALHLTAPVRQLQKSGSWNTGDFVVGLFECGELWE